MSNEGNIDWQTAVALLAEEKTRAETTAALLKKHGDAATIDRLSLAYNSAKATYDGIIAALIVALARKKEPESLADLQGRLREGFAVRQKLSNDVARLLPTRLHEKGEPLEEVVKGAVAGLVAPILEAIQAIWFRARDDDALMRKTIETQLNAAHWAAFASVRKAP